MDRREFIIKWGDTSFDVSIFAADLTLFSR